MLQSFSDVMPAELPKRLPLKRVADHKIELGLNVELPTKAPYRMPPPERLPFKREADYKIELRLNAELLAKAPYRMSPPKLEELRR